MTTKEIRKIEPTGVINADPVTPMTLVQMAIDQNADLDRLEKLMGMQERWEANQAKKSYVAAMADFRAKCPTINKTRTVDFATSKGRTTYTFAGLAETIDQIRPILEQCGLSHSWRTEQETAGVVRVTCKITHIGGHSEETSMMSASDSSGGKNGIQALASTVTYLERYTLTAMLGLASADQDDDGESSESLDFDAVVQLLDSAKTLAELATRATHGARLKGNERAKAQDVYRLRKKELEG